MGIQTLLKRGATLTAAALLASVALVMSGTAHAATTDSIYSFALTGASSTIANNASTNSGANLTLVGDWSQSSFGVHFDGDLVSKQSGGSYKPATGNTINAAATDAVGVGVNLKYQGPATGNCFSDSQNVTQIGRFGTNLGQVKVQLSNCGGSSTNVYPECRFAGSLTPNTVFPVRSTAALTNGDNYIVKCYKTPDPGTGNATVTMRVVKVDTVNGNTVTTDTFSVSPTGAITSSAYLSVANKFALPSQTANTDQFVGDVSQVSYCQATTTTAVETCLDTDVPEPAQIPQITEWIANNGLETDLSGWGGFYGSSSLVSVTRNTSGSHTGGADILVTALTGASGSSLGFNDNPRWVTNTTAGKTYTATTWVNPSFVGQKINLRLREWNGSTLVTDQKITLTAAATGWQQMTIPLTAAANGNQLSYAVYGSGMNAGDSFEVDDLSLTSN